MTRRAEFAARYGAVSDREARAAAHEAHELLRDAPEPKWRLEALNAYAEVLARAGAVPDAIAVARTGLAVARETHDAVYQASFLRRVGSLLAASDPAEAGALFEESIALCRVLENDFGLALSYHGLSYLHFSAGRIDDAIAAARIACTIRREMGDGRGLLYALVDVAQFSLLSGTDAGVASVLREALDVVRATENALGFALVVQAVAAVGLAAGDVDVAARLTGFADALYARLGVARSVLSAQVRASLADALARALPPERLAAERERGAHLEPAVAHGEAAAILARVTARDDQIG